MRRIKKYSPFVVEEVVRQVVADVSKDAAAVDRRSRVPVVAEYCLSKMPEWCRENEEQGWWHHKS